MHPDHSQLLKKLELYGAHTPCAASQLHAAIDSCLYVLSMNILQEEKALLLYIASDFAAIVYFIYCLFVTLLISSCQDS